MEATCIRIWWHHFEEKQLSRTLSCFFFLRLCRRVVAAVAAGCGLGGMAVTCG